MKNTTALDRADRRRSRTGKDETPGSDRPPVPGTAIASERAAPGWAGPVEAQAAIDLLRTMLRIRWFEERIVDRYAEQEMRTPVHLSVGQEAVAAGVCAALRREDLVFSTHRNHGHYLAKGGDAGRLAAELYGKKTGCSGGKGGSMHVIDTSCGVCGSTAIVGGNIPLAVGAALAFSVRREERVAVAFFGDGAADEGTFAESLSFAALKRLPVLFVLENNLYATNSPQRNRQPQPELYRLGLPYGIPSARVDGNHAPAVLAVARQAVAQARSGGGPTLLECLTYRWKTHVGPESDVEKGLRPEQEVDAWRNRCPIAALEAALTRCGLLDANALRRMVHEIDADIDQAFAFAGESRFPVPADINQHPE